MITLTQEEIIEGTKIICEYQGYEITEDMDLANSKYATSLDALNPVFTKFFTENFASAYGMLGGDVIRYSLIHQDYIFGIKNNDIPACFSATVKAIQLINKYKK